MDTESLDAMVAGKVKDAMSASQTELMKGIGDLFSQISSNQNSNNEAQLSKISSLLTTGNFPKFKRKSNEEQFKQNAKVLCKLDDAEKSLEVRNVDKAKESVLEAKDLVKHRQKLIKLADSSELGWRVSNEYERIPIASDSEDEKRMYKAEARANRKMKSEKSRRSSRGRNKPYWGRRQPEATVTSGQTTRAPENRRHGLCFNCSLPGHWAKECPGNKSNNKISTCLFDFTCTGNDNSKVEGSMSINNQVLSENDSQMTILTKQSELSDNCKGKNSSPNMTEDVSNSQCKVSVSTTSPVGRLKQSLHKWEQIEASRYILGVIENGYTLPFKTAPPQVCLRNNKSARENSSFVSQEIATLLSKGVISECEEQPHVVNPLTVAFNKASKPRLVLDCRHINPHLHKFRFKYEDIKIAEAMFERGSYLFTYDLRGAYHHIPIHINSRAYLGFAWQDGEVTRYYVFNVLAFGIATAGHIFSKTVREMVKYWRSLGHRVVMFLDDGIGGNTSYGLALETSRFVRASLIDFGFLLADDKCNWEPAREAVWLGHVLNMSLYKLFITNDRIKRLEIFIDSLLYQVKQSNSGLIKVRAVASAVGQIISLQSVFGKIVRLRTRELYGCILSKASWNAPVKVTQGAINELKFWRENTNPLNQEGKLINEQTICTIKMYSDASSTGYGGYLEEYNAETVHSNELNDTEVNSSEMVHRSGRIPPEVGYLDSVSYADSEPPEVGYIVVPPEVDYIGQLSCVGKESTLKDSSTGIGLKATLDRRMASAGVNDGGHVMADKMAGYLYHSRADSTNKKYHYSYKQFENYCKSKGFCARPANSIHVAMYMTEMLDKRVSFSVISAAFYAIKWAHSVNDLQDPTENTFVKNLLEAGKRLRSVPVKKKDVVNTEMLQNLCDLFKGSIDLIDIRDLAMILIGYAGFLRFNEINYLKCNDVTFNDEHLVLKIRKSKTDIYREGREVLIAKGTSSACPYEMLKRYMSLSSSELGTENYLFRPINTAKNVSVLLKTNKKMSYTRARECIVKKLKIVAPELNLGIHSLRASGATVAANAEGINERCLKRHGRWKTDVAKDGYIKDSLDKKLAVSMSLKL